MKINYVPDDDATGLHHARPIYYEPQSWLEAGNPTAFTVRPRWRFNNRATKLATSPELLMRRKSEILGYTPETTCYNWEEMGKSLNLLQMRP